MATVERVNRDRLGLVSRASIEVLQVKRMNYNNRAIEPRSASDIGIRSRSNSVESGKQQIVHVGSQSNL